MAAYKRKNSGQAMMLTMLFISGLILSASTIAGLLMFYQVRGANDAISSSMSIFAADAGIEQSLYCWFQTLGGVDNDTCDLGRSLTNGASVTSDLSCQDATRNTVDCADDATVVGIEVKSFGHLNDTERALETFICTRPGSC